MYKRKSRFAVLTTPVPSRGKTRQHSNQTTWRHNFSQAQFIVPALWYVGYDRFLTNSLDFYSKYDSEMADESMVIEDDSQPLSGNTNSSHSRKSSPTLVAQDGVIGYIKDGEPFLPRTNFNVEIVGCLKMEGYIVGYLFSIKRNDDDTTRLVLSNMYKAVAKSPWVIIVLNILSNFWQETKALIQQVSTFHMFPYRQAFLCNTDCASSSTILKVLNRAFNNRGLWIPTKDHRLDIDLPMHFQRLICDYARPDNEINVKEYFPVVVSWKTILIAYRIEFLRQVNSASFKCRDPNTPQKLSESAQITFYVNYEGVIFFGRLITETNNSHSRVNCCGDCERFFMCYYWNDSKCNTDCRKILKFAEDYGRYRQAAKWQLLLGEIINDDVLSAKRRVLKMWTCLSLTKQEVCIGESWPRSWSTYLTQWGLYSRPRSELVHIQIVDYAIALFRSAMRTCVAIPIKLIELFCILFWVVKCSCAY